MQQCAMHIFVGSIIPICFMAGCLFLYIKLPSLHLKEL